MYASMSDVSELNRVVLQAANVDSSVDATSPHNTLLGNPSHSTVGVEFLIVNPLYDVAGTSYAAACGEQQPTALSPKIDNTQQGFSRVETVDVSEDQLYPGHESVTTNGTGDTTYEATSSVNFHSVGQPRGIYRDAADAAMEGNDPLCEDHLVHADEN